MIPARTIFGQSDVSNVGLGKARDVQSWPLHGVSTILPLTTVVTWPFKRSYISLWDTAGVWFGLVVWFSSKCVTRCRDHCKDCLRNLSLTHWPLSSQSHHGTCSLSTNTIGFDLVITLFQEEGRGKDSVWRGSQSVFGTNLLGGVLGDVLFHGVLGTDLQVARGTLHSRPSTE